jgi:hypothetical protein
VSTPALHSSQAVSIEKGCYSVISGPCNIDKDLPHEDKDLDKDSSWKDKDKDKD